MLILDLLAPKKENVVLIGKSIATEGDVLEFQCDYYFSETLTPPVKRFTFYWDGKAVQRSEVKHLKYLSFYVY